MQRFVLRLEADYRSVIVLFQLVSDSEDDHIGHILDLEKGHVTAATERDHQFTQERA